MNLPNFGGNLKWVLLIGGILVCAVCALVATGGNLLQGNPTAPVVVAPTEMPGVPINAAQNGNAQLGPIVMARSVGEGNVPVETTNQFRASDRVIYAVTQGTIPSGTSLFARWSREGSPFEDTNEIVADHDYASTYIEFHISPDNVGLTPGNYSVQIFVNGNPGPQTQFTVS